MLDNKIYSFKDLKIQYQYKRNWYYHLTISKDGKIVGIKVIETTENPNLKKLFKNLVDTLHFLNSLNIKKEKELVEILYNQLGYDDNYSQAKKDAKILFQYYELNKIDIDWNKLYKEIIGG